MVTLFAAQGDGPLFGGPCAGLAPVACSDPVSLTRRYTHLLERTRATAVVHGAVLGGLDSGELRFRLAAETNRSGAPTIAVLHDGTRRIGTLSRDVGTVVHEVLARLGRRSRRLWVHGELHEGEVRIQLPSMEQIKHWME